MKDKFNVKNINTADLKLIYPKLLAESENSISQCNEVVAFYNQVKTYDTDIVYTNVHYGIIKTLIELIREEIGYRILHDVQ